MTRRVVITGVGIVSSIGNDFATVTDALRTGRSGISAVEEWRQYGITSLAAGLIKLDDEKIAAAQIPNKLRRAMPSSALYCAVAARDAVADAALPDEALGDARTACIVSSGVADVSLIHEGGMKIYGGEIRKLSPFTVIRSMSSTASAVITKLLGIKGRSYSISSACATSAHCVGHTYELIRDGIADRGVTGGCEGVNELITGSFQGLRLALSTNFNDRPQTASRPYDRDRDGFVISGGGAVLILEALEEAQARGAKIYGEIIGYSANSDPYDLVLPQADGGTFVECIQDAVASAGIDMADIDAINTHGTGTVHGDIAEVNGLRAAFGDEIPPFSSTKSMTGHGIGAAGAIELTCCLAMLKDGFIAPSINIENLDPKFDGFPIVQQPLHQSIDTMLSLNFGFGGTNAAILLRKTL